MRFPLLALLANGPAHGYELKLAMEQQFGAVLPPLNAGQIYTTLSRLERDGLVDDDAVAQNGRPNKRVYRLTEKGKSELAGWVADSTPQTRLKDHLAGYDPKTAPKFTWPERLLLGWLGPRGAAAIVFGLLAFNVLDDPDEHIILLTMVVVVLGSVLLHGLGAPIATRAFSRTQNE